MNRFKRLIKNLKLNEERMIEYNDMLNALVMKQFFGMLSIMLASVLLFNAGQQYDMMLLYGLYATAAMTSYFTLSEFVSTCVHKKLISKVFPIEVFGAMKFAALLTWTSFQMLIWTVTHDWLAVILSILNVGILVILFYRKTARPSKVARRYQEKLMEETKES